MELALKSEIWKVRAARNSVSKNSCSQSVCTADRWRINVSPKQSSLAYEEVQTELLADSMQGFEPELNLLIKTQQGTFVNSSDVIRIAGRVTVSF